MMVFEEAGGDGPIRAQYAYLWANNPSLQVYGVWPPGFMYLSGMFNLLLSKTLISTRILNVIAGSLTIPFFYLLVSRLYERRTALLSAGLLMLFPFHIALSGTSLTEVSFVFEAIAGMYCLIIGSEADGPKKILLLSLAVAFICLSTMTRYEAWLLIPLASIYYAFKTRKIGETILIAIVLMAFPVIWISGNFIHTGSALPGFDAAITGDKAKPAMAVVIRTLARLSSGYVGWFVIFAAAAGLLARFFQGLKRKIGAQEVLYIGFLCCSMAFMFKFAMERQLGLMAHGRYFLMIYVLLMPFVFIIFQRHNKKSWLSATIVFAIASGSMAVSAALYKPPMYLMREHPQDIKKFAAWLESSDYRHDYLLTTSYNSILRVYHPDGSFFPSEPITFLSCKRSGK